MSLVSPCLIIQTDSIFSVATELTTDSGPIRTREGPAASALTLILYLGGLSALGPIPNGRSGDGRLRQIFSLGFGSSLNSRQIFLSELLGGHI